MAPTLTVLQTGRETMTVIESMRLGRGHRDEWAEGRRDRQSAAAGVETPSRLASILAEPEIEANRQHDQVGENAGDEEYARGNLLIEKRDSIKGWRRKTQDEAEHADQHRRQHQVGDALKMVQRAATRWLGDDLRPEEDRHKNEQELTGLPDKAGRTGQGIDRRHIGQ